MVSACLEVTTTRDIARQLLRHRSFSFQEFSQRYADPTQDLQFQLKDARLQDTHNRQNSLDVNDADLQLEWLQQQAEVVNAAKKSYNWAIENNIAKIMIQQDSAIVFNLPKLFCLLPSFHH